MKIPLLTAALFVGILSGLHAQTGSIEILEPAAWRGAQNRNIAVVQRRSVRVVGLARHPAGIAFVSINGKRASVSSDGNAVRFVGYVTPEAATEEVVVTARSTVGDRLDERFGLDVIPSEAVYQEPDSAWNDGFDGERWAVVVGISEYADTAIRPLRYADDDARAIYDFLTSEHAGLGGFDPDNIVLLLDEEATTRNVLVALRDFLKGATEEDVVVLFFAGHGAPDPERPDQLYLLTHDTELEYLAGTAVRMEDVNDAIRQTYARTIISFTDACHSGGVGGQVALRGGGYNPINEVFLERIESSTATLVSFTASEVNQFSQEDARWGGGHGVFTHFLLRGLEGGADEDGDRIVTLGELLEWTRSRVRRETRNAQVPTISQTSFDRSWPMAIVPGEQVADAMHTPSPPQPDASRVAQEEEQDEGEASPSEETPSVPTRSEAAATIRAFFSTVVDEHREGELRNLIPAALQQADPHRTLLDLTGASGRRLETGTVNVIDVSLEDGISRVRFAAELRWRSAFGGRRSSSLGFLAELTPTDQAWQVESLRIVDGAF